ncbi:MAG TPA: hypothetical protein VN622_17140 [Clostridia bacterium]|nr:hypothetical protein [Clostridia bacterium]
MDILKILNDLRAEREHIDQAISALEALGAGARSEVSPAQKPAKAAAKQTRGGGRMSPAARKRMSEMMKRRWAERKKKQKAA